MWNSPDANVHNSCLFIALNDAMPWNNARDTINENMLLKEESKFLIIANMEWIALCKLAMYSNHTTCMILCDKF